MKYPRFLIARTELERALQTGVVTWACRHQDDQDTPVTLLSNSPRRNTARSATFWRRDSDCKIEVVSQTESRVQIAKPTPIF